jgi:hypothetical protein
MLQSQVSCSLHISDDQLVKGQKVSSSKNITKQNNPLSVYKSTPVCARVLSQTTAIFHQRVDK